MGDIRTGRSVDQPSNWRTALNILNPRTLVPGLARTFLHDLPKTAFHAASIPLTTAARYGIGTPLGIGDEEFYQRVHSTPIVSALASEELFDPRHQRPGGGFEVLQRQMPFLAATGESFVGTGQRLTDPGQYLEAYREGQLPAVLLEDVGNISLVGAGTGGAITRGATGAARRALPSAVQRMTPQQLAGAQQAVRAAWEAPSPTAGGRVRLRDLGAPGTSFRQQAGQLARQAQDRGRVPGLSVGERALLRQIDDPRLSRLAQAERFGTGLRSAAMLGDTAAAAPALAVAAPAIAARQLARRASDVPMLGTAMQQAARPARAIGRGIRQAGEAIGAGSRVVEVDGQVQGPGPWRQAHRQFQARQNQDLVAMTEPYVEMAAKPVVSQVDGRRMAPGESLEGLAGARGRIGDAESRALMTIESQEAAALAKIWDDLTDQQRTDIWRNRVLAGHEDLLYDYQVELPEGTVNLDTALGRRTRLQEAGDTAALAELDEAVNATIDASRVWLDKAVDYELGRLDTASMDRWNEALDQIGRSRDRFDAAHLEGRFERGDPMATLAYRQASQRPEMLTGAFDEAEMRMNERRSRIEADQSLTRQETQAQLEQLATSYADEVAQLADSLEVIPARYRGLAASLRSMQDAIREEIGGIEGEALAAELPVTMTALIDSEIDLSKVRFQPGGRVAAEVGVPGQRGIPTERAAPGEFAKTGRVTPRSLLGQAQRIIKYVTAGAESAYARTIANDFGRTPQSLAQSFDVPVDLDNATMLAEINAKAKGPGGPGWKYVGYDPTDPSGLVGPGKWDEGTVLIPEPLHRQLRQEFAESDFEDFAQQWIDRPVRTWKDFVLAASPNWHKGNIIGNFLLATAGAGENPVTMIRELIRAKQVIRDDPWSMNPELYSPGLDPDFRRSIAEPDVASPERGGVVSADPRARNRIRQALDRSYQWNEKIDAMHRQAVYQAKKGRGYSDAEAVRLAIEAFPDFNLTAFENRYVRRLVPFFAWQKFVTKAAFRLARDHPMRVLWTFKLGQMFGPDAEEAAADIPWLAGAMPLGNNRFLNFGNIFPWGEAVVYDPLAAGRSLTPALRTPLEMFTGLNLEDLRDPTLSTAPENRWFSYTGGELPGRPLLADPSGAAWRLLNLTPQTRTLRDMLADPVVRYDTGEPVEISGRWGPETIDLSEPMLAGSPVLGRLGSMLGLPVPTEVDVSEIRERRQAQRERRG